MECETTLQYSDHVCLFLNSGVICRNHLYLFLCL